MPADGAVVAFDADDAVRDAERLSGLAAVRPGVERAVLPAHADGAGGRGLAARLVQGLRDRIRQAPSATVPTGQQLT